MIQKLLKVKAKRLGASDLRKSTRKGKKYMVLYNGRWVHFGAQGYEDYTMHKDPKRRRAYRARHGTIRTQQGKLAYKDPNQPAYWSWHLLW